MKSILCLIILFTILFGTLFIPSPVKGNESNSQGEIINLGIQSTIFLSNESLKEFSRSFTLSQKCEIYLIHIKCQSTEQTVKKVEVNATINGILTQNTFWDSIQDYSSSNSFIYGTSLSLRVDKLTPMNYLSNSLNFSIRVTSSYLSSKEAGVFIVEEVTLESLNRQKIGANIENVHLPVDISQGEWYISPLSILRERSLDIQLFVDIMEPLYLKICVEVTPSDLPISKASTFISMEQKIFNGDPSLSNTLSDEILVQTDIIRDLNLTLRFRPSSEIKDSVLAFTLNITASLAIFSNTETSNESNIEFDLPFTPPLLLELVRIIGFLFPLFLFYKHKKHSGNDDLTVTIDGSSREDRNE